jgi:type IV pilus assembly protein PilQ
MRLKQLLGTVLLAIGTTAMAASVSQLSGVLVKSHDSAGVVTILANGAFTHTEYRPTDNLMLVDLAGVLVAHEDPAVHAVFAPGVRSYRISGYRSAGGAETARIELHLLPGAKVEVSDIVGGVELRVTGAAAVAPSKEEEVATSAAVPLKGAPLSQIRGISVSRGSQGLNIEITGSGPLTAKTMQLKGPDRLVLDIPNSVLAGRPRDIAVNSNGVKAVRAARYQADPPVTRVVVDLAATHEFDVVPAGNKLVLRLNDRLTGPTSQAAVAATALPEAPSVLPPPAAARIEASPSRAVTPAVASVSPAPSQKQPVETKNTQTEAKSAEAPRSRADVAASRFMSDVPNVPSINQPPYVTSSSMAAKPAAINAALELQQLMAQATSIPAGGAPGVSNCTSGRYTGEPIGMNFKDLDLKDFFRVIQEISGLNVVLDPAVKGTVSIYLNDVPWDQALAIVLNNNSLECQLQGNVLRIATLDALKTEAESRRAQQEAQALAVPKQTITRYLSYGQARDAALIVKKFLSARGDVVADPRSNALIIEDIPSTLPKVEDLIRTLDRKTPEVEIEARVVSASRSFARDIGTMLAPGFAQGHSAGGGFQGAGESPIATTTGVPPTPGVGNLIGSNLTKGSIPLFSNLIAAAPTSGISLTTVTQNFRLDFFLSMAENRGLAKILSRPRVITQNNIKAVIQQGQKIPIVTQGQLNGPPTVTYLDVVLRLTVTPQITAENTIFLDIDVENTSIAGKFVAGTNPALNTARTTTQVLISDGGTVVVGGVIVTTNTTTVNQVPLLGNIPLLGHLFKENAVSTETAELIFFITPKIIQT